MRFNIVAIFLVFVPGSRADLSDFVHVEYDAGDVLKPKPPLLAQRDGRFIRFDAGESEIELEMGVSVPFLKIPIPGKGGVEHSDHRVSVNPAGLLVGATLLLTSFLLVPMMFPTHGHKKRNDLSGGRADKTENSENYVEGGSLALVKEFGDVLTNLNLDPMSCSQKAICVLGTSISTKFPGLIDIMSRYVLEHMYILANQNENQAHSVIELMPFDLLERTEMKRILRAVETNSCEKSFDSCRSMPTEILSYAPWLLKLF